MGYSSSQIESAHRNAPAYRQWLEQLRQWTVPTIAKTTSPYLVI